jgi:ATP-dependent metalloprotease FtsH
MFTERAQGLIEAARRVAFGWGAKQMDTHAILTAVGGDAEASVRLAECLTNGAVADLRARCPEMGTVGYQDKKLELSPAMRELLVGAQELASGTGVPDRHHPGLIALGHLVCGIAMSGKACAELDGLTPIDRQTAVGFLTRWQDGSIVGGTLADLVGRLRSMRENLRACIFGQDHAINAFVEGLYNAQATANADTERKRPSAVFVFAGPPGVGKTYLSETCATYLERPFKRFDMTGFSDHQQHNQLVGFAPSFQSAQPGTLTSFVAEHPNAILLFDEIEKAHLNAVQLFYQILDAGRCEDKFTQQDVDFRDTIIIFTTNAGRSLYDNPNQSGIAASNATYHRRTILGALENERNPTTGQPAFPPAICSRLAQGYPVMFNHLGINELERVCDLELKRTQSLLERQYFKAIQHGPLIPISLVLREGGRVDARQLRAEAEKFTKAELYKYGKLYDPDRLDGAMSKFDSVRIELATDIGDLSDDIRGLYVPADKPQVLLIANRAFARRCMEAVPAVHWLTADSPEEALELLATKDVDLLLLDIWIQREVDLEALAVQPADIMKTVNQDNDFVPFSARALDRGRAILRKVHERAPETPIYLLSFNAPDGEETADANRWMKTLSIDAFHDPKDDAHLGEPERRSVDDELFLACVRAGGARGLVVTDVLQHADSDGWSRFYENILEVTLRLYRERKAQELARERKVLVFDTATEVDEGSRELIIWLRDFRLGRAVDAADAGELVEDVDRPTIGLDDILGANLAKEQLQYVVDWLKNPRQYTALGLRCPKGILLTGPPGTGKTMLARAVAGESDCAFLEKPGNAFVTSYQGSGAQSVRELFARARRYAPAIVFIDEIDTIGSRRSGGEFGRGYEEATNALLTEMDGFSASAQAPVIVLATTNLKETLDPALVRRFDDTIEVDKPDKAARVLYLERTVLSRAQSEVTRTAVERLAGQTAGMTIADLERIVHSAGVMAARKTGPLTDALLEEAFERERMGEAKGMPDPATLKRVAQHEAGHTLIAWLGGNPPVQVTIVGRGGAGGFMEREADEQRMLYMKDEIEQLIREAMAGRAAEIVYYGEEGGLSSGASGDLQQATAWAKRMICDYGMEENFGQIAIPQDARQGGADGPLSAEIFKAAQTIVGEQLRIALELLNEHKPHLDKLTKELLEKNRLTREELAKILPKL